MYNNIIEWMFSLNNFKIVQNEAYVRFYDCERMQYADFTTQQRIKGKEIITCLISEDIFIKDKDDNYFTIDGSLYKEIYVNRFDFLLNEIKKYPKSEFINIILTLPIWHNYQ